MTEDADEAAGGWDAFGSESIIGAVDWCWIYRPARNT